VSGTLQLYICGVKKTYRLDEKVHVANQTTIWNVSASASCDYDGYGVWILTLKVRNLTDDAVMEYTAVYQALRIRGAVNINTENELEAKKAALDECLAQVARLRNATGSITRLRQNLSACQDRIEYLQTVIDSYTNQTSRLNSILRQMIEENGNLKSQLQLCTTQRQKYKDDLSSCEAKLNYMKKLVEIYKAQKDYADMVTGGAVVALLVVVAASIILFVVMRRRYRQCTSLNSSL